MKRLLAIMAMAFAAVQLDAFAEPTVSDVVAKQRFPWNGKVDITYTLTGDVTVGVPDSSIVLFSVTASNRVDGATYTAGASALSGDTGTAEGAHHIVWDLNSQGLEIKSDEVVFTVSYKTYDQYCVIDLSGGANAATYPVTYLAEAPLGGFNTDEYKTTKLVLRLIKPGTFLMSGSYQVTLTKPFYCGVFEVTQKQYELVTGSNPSFYEGDMRPVEQVSWNTIRGDSSTYNWPSSASVDSNSFVGRLQARTGLNFDLPTEAQWEYACRAGTTSQYNNGGDTERDLRELGRYWDDKSDGKGGYSGAHTKVGSYQPNAWGLYDMHGNVWEWCLDWDGNLSSGVTDPVGSSSGSDRVIRGGGWDISALDCSSSCGYDFSPSHVDYYIGFRLVRTLSNTNSEHSPEAEAAPVAIDSRREPLDDSIVVSWDASWIGGDASATVVITDNGVEVKRTTGVGEFEYQLTGPCKHTLTYKTLFNEVVQEETYTATVFKGWAYEVDDDGDAILVDTAYKSGNVVIPFEIDGHAVVGIADEVFRGCDSITGVTIPDSVWNVGEGAFAGCASLRRVEAPIGLKRLLDRDGVFAYCPDDLEVVYHQAEISDVTARQRYPWNGKVDITYILTGDVTAGWPPEAEIVLSVTASNCVDGVTYTAEAYALSGDTGTAEGAHLVVWDLNAQGLEIKSDEVVFTVSYQTYDQYCVIDLSGGANAASYPVSYLTEAPLGGFNTDEYKTTKLVLRLIAPGTFMMGGSYQVTLTKPFYCGVFEVTQKQYELVTGSNPSSYKGDMRPVEQVSWNTIRGNSSTYNWPSSANVYANSFVGRLQARTGLNFDLPTEAQWEYACRAGTTSQYNNGGNTENDLRELGRYSGNQSDGKGGYSYAYTKVGSYQPNAWGLYDMHGNVWEWCLDWYGSLSGGVTDPAGSSSGSYRVERGGSWDNDAYYCTSSIRYRVSPSSVYGNGSFGFRLVRTLSSTNSEHSHEAVAGAERADALCAAEAAPAAIDSRLGENPVLETIVLPWNAEWIVGDAGATVVIEDNGTIVTNATGMGEFELVGDGRHDLTYTTYIGGEVQDEVYTATVFKGWAYEVDDNGDAFLVDTAYKAGDVVIPSEIDGHAVVGIAGGVFYGCIGLKSVIIPESVTSIGGNAFGGCGAIETVVLPISLKEEVDAIFADSRESIRNLTLAGDAKSVGALQLKVYGLESEVSMRIEVRGTGSLSFRWKASSEYDSEVDAVYDYAFVTLDDEALGSLDTETYKLSGYAIGGETDWVDAALEIVGDGVHTVTWTYRKDDLDEIGGFDDCIWLDEVVWEPVVCVSFQLGGGAGIAPDTIVTNSGSVIALPSSLGLAKAKHRFAGWSDGNNVYAAGENYTLTPSDVTFTAQWMPNTISLPSITSAQVEDGGVVTDAASVTITILADDGATIHYTLDGTVPTAESPVYVGPLVLTDYAVTVKAVATREDYFDSDVADFSFTRLPYTLAECLGLAQTDGVEVSTGGDGNPWHRVLEGESHDGVAGLRSGAIMHSQTNWVEITVNGPGTCSFWWKASSESIRNRPRDGAVLFVDGTQVGDMIGGTTCEWGQVVDVAVEGDGEHTFRWIYAKSPSDQAAIGEDCAWLDEVVWTPKAAAPTVDVDDTKMEVPIVDEASGTRVIAAKEGQTLTADDVAGVKISSPLDSSDITEAYVKTLVDNQIIIELATPEVESVEEEEEKAADDPSGMLVEVEPEKVVALPQPAADEEVGALPVKAYPGLYYQASWGDDLNSLTTGEKVQASGDSLYLGVIKQKGDKGFYKLSVSEK